MAKELRLLYVLWIVVAVFATSTATASDQTTVPDETPTTSESGTVASTSESGTVASTSESGTVASTSESGTVASTSESGTVASTSESGITLSTTITATNDPNATDASTTEGPASTAATSPSTQPPNPCLPNPCDFGSTCEARADQTHVCLCLPGDIYNNETNTCNRARVFPGQLVLQNKQFVPEMRDKTSQIFENTANYITTTIEDRFRDDEYIGSIVLELRPLSNGLMRETSTGVDATVEIAFKENYVITATEVQKKMDGISNATFTAKALCEDSTCDKNNSKCTEGNGLFTCVCLEGHINSSFTDRSCVACVDEKEENGICVPCSFGYSGFNCEDDWLYLLTIIGSVLGGLLLITLIALLVVLLKSPKKSSKKSKSKNEDIGRPYISHSAAKAPQANGSYSNGAVGGPANGLSANVGAPRIPRATTNSAWGSRTNMEMTPANSRQNLIATGTNSRLNDDRDDMFSYSKTRPQNNLYAQSRPQNNPYAQNRANINPYAENRGQSNHYYAIDD